MLQDIALAFFAAALFASVEWARGHAAAPTEVRVKLRALWRGWPTRAFGRYAYHETPEPTRKRLRRSAWASVAFALLWAAGAVLLLGWPWGLLALLGIAYAVSYLRVLHRGTP